MNSISRTLSSASNIIRQMRSISRCACSYSQAIVYRTPAQQRSYSTEPLAAPTPEGEPKVYSAKIQQIVDDISQLTLLEVADLNELLKKTLNITDAPVMAAASPIAGAPAAAQEEEEEEVKPKQALFTVRLTQFDTSKKVALIKEIKGLIAGMNLVQAKKFVEGVPQDVKTEVSKEEGETLKKALEAAGGSVELV